MLDSRRDASGYEDMKTNEEIDNLRAERVIRDLDRFDEDPQQDPVLIMMTSWYDSFESYCRTHGNIDQLSFEKEISKLAGIIINRKYREANHEQNVCRYSDYYIYDEDTGIRKTLLHVAAEGYSNARNNQKSVESHHMKRNFTDIAKILISSCPGLVYSTTEGEKWGKLPVELALLNFDDEMASLLIKSMLEKCRVRMLFEHDYSRGKTPRFRFIDLIERKDMKKTVIAVLDSLINPEWPFLPLRDSDGADVREKWQHLIDTPTRYHFYFRILDGDRYGRKPYRLQDANGSLLKDELYEHRDNSCLHALCFADDNTVCIRHPVVRLLARRKWDAYGRFYIRLHFFLYIIFLAFLSVAILGAVPLNSLQTYQTGIEIFRLVSEVASFFFATIYFIMEVDQFQRETVKYFKDFFNYFDLLGILSVLVLFPLRWSGVEEKWELCAFAYIFNTLRIFKYFSAFRGPGVYVRTLVALAKENMPVFFSVYGVFALSLTGGGFVALRASSSYNTTTGYHDISISGYRDMLLRSFRAVAEGQTFADNYDGYSAYAIVIILCNMLVITLILVNILIAQLSDSYARMQADAVTQYDISKAIFTTRIENSRIPFFRLRVKYYEEGCFVTEKDLVKELCSDWKTLHQGDEFDHVECET